ncbi:MAG: hypothetical protein IKP68_01080 [Clostridia bacterium]|nr:hypothetical protein [Clostridia bacterium]
MKPKIRFFAVLLAMVFAFSLVSCGEKEPINIFGGFISAIKSCDAKSASACVSSGSSIEKFSDAIALSDDFERETLKDVFSLIGYTVISENVERDEAGSEVVITDKDRQTIRIEISAPDFASLMSLAMSEVMYSSKPKTDVMRDFLDDGTVGRYVKKMTLDVVIVKESGEWKLPLSQKENKQLYDALKLDSFAPWLLG